MKLPIPDGEYNLDISCLAEFGSTFAESERRQAQEETFSIRYGFVPDSMDPTKPLTIFRLPDEDNRYAIKAPSVDEGDDVILEGTSLGGIQPGQASEHVMAFEDGQFVMHSVYGAIRASRSRNPKSLASKTNGMGGVSQRKDPSQTPGLSSKPKTTHTEAHGPAPLAKPRVVAPAPRAQKRLPVASPVEEVILNDSDFDDLDFAFDGDSNLVVDPPRPLATPVVSPAQPPKPKPLRSPERQSLPLPSSAQSPGGRAPPRVAPPAVASKRLPPSSAIPTPDFHSDDEFGDIENELEQLLQGESSGDEGFKMEIDEGSQAPEHPRRVAASQPLNVSRDAAGPISLRGLSANGRRREEEDMSSSEEE